MLNKRLIAAALLSVTCCLPGVVHATETVGGDAAAASGQKLDSGLGEVPKYRGGADHGGRPARFVPGGRIGVLRAN
jgi:hypothetical protein